MVHVLSDLTGLRAAMMAGTPTAGIGKLQAFSTQRACPVCSTSYAELDPRLFSYNSKHGWCPDCVGTGVRLTKEQRKVFDDSVRDDDHKGREQTFAEPEVEDVTDAACPTCQGTRLNATARAVRFGAMATHQVSPASVITDLARLSVTDIRQWVEALAADRPRQPRSRATWCPRSRAAWSFWRRSAWATSRWTAARPRSAAARPSASAWPRSSAATCRACATCSTSRPSACTRATTRSC